MSCWLPNAIFKTEQEGNNGAANGAASKAYLPASYLEAKCIIMKYKTGTCSTQNMRNGLSTQRV
jgi:hypothetical protein